jgi:hypothetical protein
MLKKTRANLSQSSPRIKDVGDDIWALFPNFQVKFPRNLALEIISFYFEYVVQLFRKLPVPFRTSGTITYAQKIIYSRRPKKH